MSYLEFEIGGKVRGLKFNQLCHAEYVSLAGGSNNEVLRAYALIYAALYANCIVKREEPDFDFEKVSEWVDAIKDSPVFADIIRVYKSTLPPVEEVKKKTVQPVKKRSAPKNTKRSASK